MSENNLELEFQKFNLNEGDCLVVRVNTSNMSEEEAVKKLAELHEDDFLKYVEERGNKVFITYSGIKLEILRLLEGDKLAAYVDVTSMEPEEEEKYLDYIKHKLVDLEGKVVIIPMRNDSPQVRVVNEGEEI